MEEPETLQEELSMERCLWCEKHLGIEAKINSYYFCNEKCESKWEDANFIIEILS